MENNPEFYYGTEDIIENPEDDPFYDMDDNS